MGSRISRRRLLADVLGDDARAALARFATGAGVAPARAQGVADAAVVRVFRGAVPRDRELADTALRLEIRRVAASAADRIGTAPEAAPVAMTPRTALRRRVRLARARHVGLVAGAAVLACALTAGASFAIARTDRSVPAGAPEMPVVPPPEVVEEPTTPATPRVLGPVTEGPGVPAASPLVEGMLENAGPGWSIVQLDAGLEGPRTLLYLADPEGALYEIPTPIAEAPWGMDPIVLDWLPGTRLVLASWWWRRELAVVDVLTGERVLSIPNGVEGHTGSAVSAEFVGDGTTDVLAAWVWHEGLRATPGGRMVRLGLDGTERAMRELEVRGEYLVDEPVLSDAGTRVAVVDREGLRILDAVDFADVAVVPGPHPGNPAACAPERWLGDSHLLVGCRLDVEPYTTELWVVPADAGEPARIANGDAHQSVWRAGDALILLGQEQLSTSTPAGEEWGYGLHRCGFDGSCEDAVFGELTPWAVVGVVDGTLFAFDAPYESGVLNGQLVAVDLETGQARILLDSGPDGTLTAVVPWGARGRIWFGGE